MNVLLGGFLMKPSRLVTLVTIITLLCVLLSGCRNKDEERKKAEELSFKKERMEKINQRMNEINDEIARLENSISELNREVDNYMFKTKNSLNSLKNSHADIHKAVTELQNFIIPPEPAKKPGLHWFFKLIILIIIIIALTFAVVAWRNRHKGGEDEEFAFEESPAYEEDGADSNEER